MAARCSDSADDEPVAVHMPSVPEVFVEIVRDERDGTLTLNFRRKGRPVDGQAFFCLCQSDVAQKADSLFTRLSRSTKDLKLFSVQADSFHHTGVLECGYCTVQQSVGSSKLRNIKPNVPYVVAIAINAERWSKRALASSSASRGGSSSVAHAPTGSLGDDPTPFLDKVQLRELVEQTSKLKPAFHLVGRNPWRDNLIPSLECARYLAWQCFGFFKKYQLHLQHGAAAEASDPNGDMQNKKHRGGHHGRTGLDVQSALLERQLVIHGVTDPLCGIFVAFALSMADIVRKFRVASGSGELLRGSPTGAAPSAGDILDAMSILGSRVQHSTLSASWVLDWFDVLLLATVDSLSLKRVMQVASQFKSYDIEGQPLQSRLSWMLRPEKRPPVAGTLQRVFVSEATRLGLEPLVSPPHMVYVACVLSPARAVWTCMTHRQQVRALYYVTPLAVLEEEVVAARRTMLLPSVVQSLQRNVRRSLARNRLRAWMGYVAMIQERREVLRLRESRRSTADFQTALRELLERADLTVMQAYLGHWFRHRIRNRFVLPMLGALEHCHLRSRFRCWRLSTMRQYNIRVPRHSTLAACGESELLPMPRTWIRKVQRRVDPGDGFRRAWTVFVELGNGSPTVATNVGEPARDGQRRCSEYGPAARLQALLSTVTRHRLAFHTYRIWRRFAEIASTLRTMQQRQVRAVLRLAEANTSLSASLRVLYMRWKCLAESKKHQRAIVAASHSVYTHVK